ncbi:MAG: BMC domain-containing protein [Thermodesulfobacteriota bacterium]|nr:BMC domain-containing protein [Thermodesulfobacteriota bacterium]
MNDKALGIFETIGFVPAVTGADAALKSAEVELLGCRYVGSGLVAVLFSGDVSSVKVAVESGCYAAKQVGSVKWQTVIARTAEGLDSVVADDKPKGKRNIPKKSTSEAPQRQQKQPEIYISAKNISEPDLQGLSDMSVVKLRELARQFPGISLDRRKIRSARKNELIDAIISDYQKNKE